MEEHSHSQTKDQNRARSTLTSLSPLRSAAWVLLKRKPAGKGARAKKSVWEGKGRGEGRITSIGKQGYPASCHFADENTEAQRHEVTCRLPQSWEGGARVKPGSEAFRPAS